MVWKVIIGDVGPWHPVLQVRAAHLYVLMKMVGTRLYRHRLAVPVDMFGSVSFWEQLEKQ